jgi:alanine racemase
LKGAIPARRYSLANSAGICLGQRYAFGLTRPGLALYGGIPRAEADGNIRPVVRIEAQVLQLRDVPKGATIGYGATFTAERPLRVGVAACGYADGYPRHAPTGTPVLVAGQRTRTLGRVSMDMLACDLTDLPEAGVGSPVVLWGGGLPADEVAAAAGTISYELFCALTPRVPVRWIGVGEQI